VSCYAVIDTNVIVSALISKNDDAATVRGGGILKSTETDANSPMI